MPKYETIRTYLPMLFRPESGDSSVISAFIRSVGSLLDDLNQDMGVVLQSHWAGLADDARFNPYMTLDRLLNESGPLNLKNPEDHLTWDTFPYVHDLARIGAPPFTPCSWAVAIKC